jgi:uncharacterized membrane protein YkvA (DUF1232 family)
MGPMPTASRKKKPKRPSRPSAKSQRGRQADKLTDSLQKRLQNELAESLKRAAMYVADPERLQDLIAEAGAKVKSLPRQQLRDMWTQLQTMLRLAQAYSRGDYRTISPAALLRIVGALLYLVNPLDLLPDSIPGIGLLDDVFVLSLTIRRTRDALNEFATWEEER